MRKDNTKFFGKLLKLARIGNAGAGLEGKKLGAERLRAVLYYPGSRSIKRTKLMVAESSHRYPCRRLFLKIESPKENVAVGSPRNHLLRSFQEYCGVDRIMMTV